MCCRSFVTSKRPAIPSLNAIAGQLNARKVATANRCRHVQSRPSGWIGTELVNPTGLTNPRFFGLWLFGAFVGHRQLKYRRLLMLWTAPPPARECHGYGCC